MDPIQDFTKVQLTLDNVIIPNERLRNTPSLKDGCPHELEVDLRVIGCEYIQTAGVLLRLPQVAMATAQVLFQRFFYSKSLVKYNMLYVAMACIYAAAKIEETCRRIRDVANVFHHLKQKRMGRPVVPMEYMGEEYFKLKASIIKYERFILKDLGFGVHVKHPHKLIIAYLQILGLEKNTSLAQKAWNYMNDGLRTNIFVRFPPETIACSCIFLSARQLRIGLPQRPPWWTVFDVTYEDIEAISSEIIALYQRPRVFLVDLEKKLNVIKEEFTKKHIEIKEVNLKKISSGISAGSSSSALSPGSDGKVTENGKEKSLFESPPPSAVKSTTKLQPSPLVSSQNHSQKITPTKNNSISPVAKGKSSSRPVSPHPLERKKRKRSRSPSHSPILEKKARNPEQLKPIISPIRVASRVASSGDSLSDGSGSPRQNGVPKQYRRNNNKHKESVHKTRRKEHRHRHHKVHHQERHHHRHGYEQHHSKIRRTESNR